MIKQFQASIFIPYNLAYYVRHMLGIKKGKATPLFRGQINVDSIRQVVTNSGYEFDNKCALIGFNGPDVYYFLHYDSNQEIWIKPLKEVEEHLNSEVFSGGYDEDNVIIRAQSILEIILRETSRACFETYHLYCGWRYTKCSWDTKIFRESLTDSGFSLKTDQWGNTEWAEWGEVL